jgi:hypothetical protein
MIVLSEQAKAALQRAQRAYLDTQGSSNARTRNREENRFYAAAEALFHVIWADQENQNR